MKITMLGKTQFFDSPLAVREIIAAMAPEYTESALGCFCGGSRDGKRRFRGSSASSPLR